MIIRVRLQFVVLHCVVLQYCQGGAGRSVDSAVGLLVWNYSRVLLWSCFNCWPAWTRAARDGRRDQKHGARFFLGFIENVFSCAWVDPDFSRRLTRLCMCLKTNPLESSIFSTQVFSCHCRLWVFLKFNFLFEWKCVFSFCRVQWRQQ